jgi:hypothetical protein
MSIRATSVAWPTSLLNSPMWALLQRFPEISPCAKGKEGEEARGRGTYSEDAF